MRPAHPPATRTIPRHTRLVAVVAAIALAAGAIQLIPQAGADDPIIAQVASTADSAAVDVNRDGIADYAGYGASSRWLSVGEQPADGSDLRLFVPFTVSRAALVTVLGGASATVAIRVHSVSAFARRSIVVEASTTPMTATRTGYRRLATRVVSLAPVRGRMVVDVTRALRSMESPGTLTLRIRLDRPAAEDGTLTRATIGTSDAFQAQNRPVLTVTLPGARAGTLTPADAPQPAPRPAGSEASLPPPPPPAPPSPPAAVEIFRDDFNGSTLDLAKWRPNWLAGTDNEITKPVNSAELSCYDPAQVSVAGGSLHLRAVTRPCRANNGLTYPHASGLVESAHDFTFTYGRLEARMWLPPGSGAAANWPAFWANGTGTWPVTGELDVVEGLAGRACWHFHSTAGGPGGCAPWPSPAGWHTFAAEWRAGSVTYFYDGQPVGRMTSGITSSPMYLVLNLGVSNTLSPPVQLPSEMLVDWVRVLR